MTLPSTSGPDGALYVIDFGTIHIAPEHGAIRQQMYTGTLWRIRRTGGTHGRVLPAPASVPIYLLQGLALLVGAIGLGIVSTRLLRKIKENRNGRDR